MNDKWSIFPEEEEDMLCMNCQGSIRGANRGGRARWNRKRVDQELEAAGWRAAGRAARDLRACNSLLDKYKKTLELGPNHLSTAPSSALPFAPAAAPSLPRTPSQEYGGRRRLWHYTSYNTR